VVACGPAMAAASAAAAGIAAALGVACDIMAITVVARARDRGTIMRLRLQRHCDGRGRRGSRHYYVTRTSLLYAAGAAAVPEQSSA
jgi:hypothetical protein